MSYGGFEYGGGGGGGGGFGGGGMNDGERRRCEYHNTKYLVTFQPALQSKTAIQIQFLHC